MFVHTGENLPADPEFPVGLEELGYKLNEDKEIVSKFDGHHFIFYHSNNERANEKRKEAMHETVRTIVAKELKGMGLDEIWLGEEGGETVMGLRRETKPYPEEGKCLNILATDFFYLLHKRDVIVVVGDPNEDAGIWAWRHVLGKGGIEDGSAVGLVKKVAELGLNSNPVIWREEPEKTGTAEKRKSVASTATGQERKEFRKKIIDTETAGIVILNPGALYYSASEHKTMTWPTWRARPREHALGEDYVIDDEKNRIEGHYDSYEHISTCFDSILPQLLHHDAQLFVVAVGSSAEFFIDWYQNRHCTVGTSHVSHADVPGIHKRIAAMALMEPTHNATKIKCKSAEMMLNEYGRQWIKSTKALGTLLNTPKTLAKDPDVATNLPCLRTVRDSGGPLTSHPPSLPTAMEDSELDTPELPSLPTAMGGSELHLPDYAAANPSTEATHDSDSSSDGSKTVVPDDDQKTVVPDTPSDVNPTELSGTTAVDSDIVDLAELSNAVSELTAKDNDEFEDARSTMSYDHANTIVNCKTYSGETDVDEMIWPNAMDMVLDFFLFEGEKMASRGRRAQ